MMAADADVAVGIVRQREDLARVTEHEKSLFSVALELYLRAAVDATDWSTKSHVWKHAGVIVRFGEMVGIPVEMPEGARSRPSPQIRCMRNCSPTPVAMGIWPNYSTVHSPKYPRRRATSPSGACRPTAGRASS